MPVMTEERDRYGRSRLHYAAVDNDVETVRALLDAGADASARDKSGHTPLHGAAQQGALEVARLLLERGADFHAYDRFGNAPLWTAVFNAHGKGPLVELLLAYGSDPRHANAAGRTPLDMAVVFSGTEQPDWVRRLVAE
jgi:ankyrin repeat protein